MRRHAFGIAVVLVERERDRAPDGGGQPPHPVHLLLGRGKVLAQRAGRGELEHRRTELAQHAADAEQLVLRGERAGHRLTVDGPVCERARRREAECAGRDAVAHDGRHRLDVVSRRRLVPSAALAHHVSRAPRRAAPARRCRCAFGRRSSVSRYSGNDSHAHSMPADKAAPGMSSTPSINPMSHS